MFEFEELSSGFHDVFNKYSESSIAPMMDFYISDSMQDMLDIDIRSEVATVVGGANEFSSLMNFDLPSLDIDSNSNDVHDIWLGGPKWNSATVGHNAADIYADVGACVNPNSVMPLNTSAAALLLKSPKNHLNLNRHHMYDSLLVSPREKKSHLTFSPSSIKLSQMVNEQQNKRLMGASVMDSNRENVKKDLSEELGEKKAFQKPVVISTFANTAQKIKLNNQLKVINNTISNLHSQQQKMQRSSSPKLTFLAQHQPPKFTPKNVIHLNGRSSYAQSQNVLTSNNSLNSSQHMYANTPINKKSKQPQPISEFPKPAYSYSCLIAMALKNSRAGSLPVSEIYSFMCEHFPYFKTAPNGWKNSVRHNLSLNKCFEKIEKPVSSGGQRKGCLWAMNPSKVTKMDEEVQKWSRKDPMAIKKAMVYPEHLEALERGEMKHGHNGDSDDEENDVGSEENESENDQNDVEDSFVHTPEDKRPASIAGSSNDDEPDVDFDIEVSDFYGDIDIEDSAREALALEISGDLDDDDNSMFSPMHQAKRARLDVNYSIQSTNHQLNHSHSRRKTPHVNRLI